MVVVRVQVVYVYETRDYEHVATLKGHAENVCDLRWSGDEVRLVSVCRAAVYTWSMETFAKVRCRFAFFVS